jgi:hypothetical protein
LGFWVDWWELYGIFLAGVKEKMTYTKKNVEQALMQLAQLMDIDLESFWKKEISEFFGVPQSLVSKWIDRGRIPKPRQEYANKMGYPIHQWYLNASGYIEKSSHIQDKSGLWGKTREVSANGKVVKLTLYEAEKQHDEPQVAISTDLAPLVYRLEKALVGQKEDIAMLIKVLDKADDAEIMRSVARILTSGETSTAMALKMNVMEFGEKIEKEKKLKGTIYGMEQQIIATNAEVAKLKAELSKEKKGPPGLREPVDPVSNDE